MTNGGGPHEKVKKKPSPKKAKPVSAKVKQWTPVAYTKKKSG